MATSEAPECDRELYREVTGHFASGVTVITARHEGVYCGIPEARGLLDDCDALIERCMSEYDVDGRTDGVWYD